MHLANPPTTLEDAIAQLTERTFQLDAARQDSASHKIKALRHALAVITSKRVLNRHPAYLAALDDLEISYFAAIERLEHGEQMESIAIVQ